MAIPDYQSCMLPLLKFYGDGREYSNRESIETLAQLMIDHGVGVSTVGTYEIKKIDSDYFSEE